jgi:hypothetical protein
VAVVDPDTGTVDTADWVTLPAGYVGVNVELEYAGTVHAAQGGTRVASQALVGERDTANGVYVALTRGRESNVAHVDSQVEAGHDQKPSVENPVAVLARVVGREDSAEAVSGIEARDLAVTKAKSVRTLFPIWQDLQAEHAKDRWQARLSGTLGDNVALSVTGSAAWPTLVARLATIEAAGGDPDAALLAAIGSRGLGDAGDMAAVLHYRLELDASRAERAGSLHALFSLRDIGESRYTAALRRVGSRMDQRIVELGEQAAQDPPGWAAPLGPVPEDTVGRMEWAERAATVASYREAFTVEGSDPIGATPPPARPEARRWWMAASEALAVGQAPALQATLEDLADRVAAGDRAEMERPKPARLGEAAKVDRDVQAELTFAVEHQRMVLADPKATLADLEDADSWVAAAGPAAQLAAAALRDAEAGHQKRREWESQTATTRAAADTARKELAARAAPTVARTQDLMSLPTSWVAYQAVQADHALAAKTTALTSAHQAVRRVAARAERRSEEGHTEEAAEDLALLERWQADAARLDNEVAAARSDAQRINDELTTRADGEGAKTAARNTPTGRIPTELASIVQGPTPGEASRPPQPGI